MTGSAELAEMLAVGLPADLQALIDQINAEQIAYLDREDDAKQLENYLAQGNHSTAKFVAEQMIERQRNTRHVQAHGLPPQLQALINQVYSEQIAYLGREDDAKQLENYLAQGNHSTAKFVAGQMIERQQQYRRAQAYGLPPQLQALIDQVNAEQTAYLDREADAKQLENYLAQGNHSTAKFVAEQMIERQRNIRHAQAHGLPPQLQALIDLVNAEQTAYLDHEADAKQLENYLAQGNHSTAKFVAEQMIERQRNIRHAQAHGLPPQLQALIDLVNAEQTAYFDREADAKQLENYLAQGNHSTAKFVAEQMIERQRNISGQN
ncbi:hypothetical protein RBU55_00995 [Pseudomonas chlororaphis subsp. aurantiaca]|uniref:hypothetical protein n=1 Tax=Pseudomonas chlororaphis TaxID=587753 RepID=UPI0027DBF0C9|nr:hypothetical protein [Pseudomonas chlororaphis]WMJ00161.1 hypothetical protein RBU55_00995 [Pseudomonas chlororaphis subsp. aurantiaca]